MVRAAVAGAVDYSRADPSDIQWRIKHRLLLGEVERHEEQKMLDSLHRHWCAYLAHGGLTEDSFIGVKKSAGDTLTALQRTIFPWQAENSEETSTQTTEAENSKLDGETQQLIERFKIWRGTSKGGE
jgi:hypothetical protein